MRSKLAILSVFFSLCAALMLQPWGSLEAEGKKLGLKTVVIDAGHGGKDPGGVSRDKTAYEKNLVLDIAKRFGSKIKEKYPDVKQKWRFELVDEV